MNKAVMSSQSSKYKLEEHVNDWIKKKFDNLKLKNQKNYYTESAIPDYMKDALRGRAKTERKTNFGKPDFSLPHYKQAPVVIESKLGLQKLISNTNGIIKFDDKSIQNYAVNGALYYATGMIASGKYRDVIAIGIAGDSNEAIDIQVYYVFGSGEHAYKLIDNVSTLDFLENEKTFNEFYKNAILTEYEKHEILINSQAELQKYAKSLNKLMHNHNITAPQRVLYVSGMLLSMQVVTNANGDKIQDGLTPEDLKGIQTESRRDGVQIVNQIKEFLTAREIPADKQNLMLASFSEISKDVQRDEITELDKEVSKRINGNASSNKQIFSFIYHNIYLSIDAMVGHIDIMGEMYSEFLKYALGDGKEIGIVLTPPYITKMMATILNVNKDSKVMDLATGSAGFLISAMELMIQNAETSLGKKTSAAEAKIDDIKKKQLLGVELNAEMFTLAATNMILRGDGSSNIHKGSTFSTPENLYRSFNATRLLLNPPFSYQENGMPFISFGLDKMGKGGLGAIIIQDSAGSGKAVKTNKAILKKHTLIASIKMPIDLFQPMAGVQTSIYIFEAKKPHDIEQPVRFIDFRNDGYKRTSRAIQEIDEPTKRYSDIIKIYKAGKNAKIEATWNLDEVYVEDFITISGADWNFDQHKRIDTKPTFFDFRQTVAEYFSWELQIHHLLKMECFTQCETVNLLDYTLSDDERLSLDRLDTVPCEKFNIKALYGKSSRGRRLKSAERTHGSLPFVTAGEINMGISDHIGNDVHIFPENTVTIDMFGSAKYRNYNYGADDHVAVIHTQLLSKFAALYLTAAIHKTSHAGQFDYSRNFYASDADELNIDLPIAPDGSPDYDYMTLVISAMQKIVVKNVVDYYGVMINKTIALLNN